MMRAAVFHGAGLPIAIEAVPDEPLPEGWVRLAVRRCGVCGSDVSMTSGGAFDYPAGCRLGHEYSGEVVEVGHGVSRLRVGDRVACMPKAGCGSCWQCARGRPIFCPHGPMLFGGFAERIAVPESAAFRLPESVGFAEAALVEPMACGLRALRMAQAEPGQRLLVLGGGAIAMSVIFWARALGMGRVVVASRTGRSAEAALSLGADAVHAFLEDDGTSLTQALGGPPDLVAECVGRPGMIGEAVDHVAHGGTVISLGMCVRPDAIMPAACAFKEARILFPVAYSTSEFAETLSRFDSGALDLGFLVTETIPLDALPDRLDCMRAGASALKVQVDPGLSS